MSADVNKIKKLLDKYFEINGDIAIHPDTGIVDVAGNNGVVKLKAQTIINTLPVQFGRVDGKFDCSNNQLTSLQGSPASVGGDFFCRENQLTSLRGAPISVGGSIDCTHNQLISLQGAPSTLAGGGFYCSYNQLTTLEHSPKIVADSFYCENNQLTSLQGAPASVGGFFSCMNNQLKSLQGAPKYIKGIWWMTVYPNTPLLRILTITGITSFSFREENNIAIFELNRLFKKYYPQGRQGILKCGLEMMSIENGKYANNARMGPK